MAKHPFSQQDLDRITEAVKAAEKKTSGEIVVYFTTESDNYEEISWRGFVLFSFVILLPALIMRIFTDLWIFDLAMIILMAIFSGGIALLAVMFIPPFKRFLAGESLLDHRVDDQATIAFVEKEVFNTRDRTGILIFLSIFERRVRIIGDTHINAKVKPGEWEVIVQTVVNGMLSGDATQGLIRAISQCGELLRIKGFSKHPDDINELPNQMIIGDKE